MRISRPWIALSLATLIPIAAHAHVRTKSSACSTANPFTTKLDHLDGYRVFTGPDGDSAVEPYRIDAKIVPLLKTGKKLGLIELPRSGARAPEIVVGAANVDLPFHAAPYREMFVLLAAGSHSRPPSSVRR